MTDNVFPSVETTPFGSKSSGGLTKRELFAAMICAGFSSLPMSEIEVARLVMNSGRDSLDEVLAESAVARADELIAELAKEPEP